MFFPPPRQREKRVTALSPILRNQLGSNVVNAPSETFFTTTPDSQPGVLVQVFASETERAEREGQEDKREGFGGSSQFPPPFVARWPRLPVFHHFHQDEDEQRWAALRDRLAARPPPPFVNVCEACIPKDARIRDLEAQLLESAEVTAALLDERD
ncbi:hypothetical protein BDZ88DRAFT_439356 [Geranomyces variabilis]|nr:hypothetical protein BDZ88DRAFT_439356 [Geranomyces variabilis]